MVPLPNEVPAMMPTWFQLSSDTIVKYLNIPETTSISCLGNVGRVVTGCWFYFPKHLAYNLPQNGYQYLYF
jgi:hypothetical protein